MRAEESKLRETMRKESKVKRTKEKGASKGLTGGYLEDGEDEDESDDDATVSIAKIKNKYKSGGPASLKGTLCPGGSDPFYIVTYFLDTR